MRTPKKKLEQCKALIGARVRLTCEVQTRGGDVFEKGSLWRVEATWRGTFHIIGIDDDGQVVIGENGCIARYVRGVERWKFDVAHLREEKTSKC